MVAYKLVRKLKDGTFKSLFIDRTKPLPKDQWLEAEPHPTPGFAFRPGWHCCPQPVAPHLSTLGRVWLEVEVEDYTEHQRPESQGGTWLLAKRMKILGEL